MGINLIGRQNLLFVLIGRISDVNDNNQLKTNKKNSKSRGIDTKQKRVRTK